MTGFAMLAQTEARLAARDVGGLLIPFGLPLLILVMNGAALEGAEAATVFETVIVPVSLALVVTMIALVNMPATLASYRTTGVLRRLAATPARPITVLVAHVTVSLAQVLVGIALALVVAGVGFGAGMPDNLAGAAGMMLLATAALYALGMVVAAVAPSTNSAIAIGIVLFFAMMTLGGGFGPVDALPEPLPTIGEHTPFGAAAAGMGASWAGGTPELAHVVALAGTTLVAGVAAARVFRWE